MGIMRRIKLITEGAVYCDECNNKREPDKCHVRWTRTKTFTRKTKYGEVRVKRSERNKNGKCKYWKPYNCDAS